MDPGKDCESSFYLRQILLLFCKSNAVIVGENCVKGLCVTKIFKQIKFERVWGELDKRNCF